MAEIYRQTVEVYGEGAVNEGIVSKWCRLFEEGGINVHDEEANGHANSSSGIFSSTLSALPTAHQLIFTWPARVGVTKRQKTLSSTD
jgi:hypothetical protein